MNIKLPTRKKIIIVATVAFFLIIIIWSIIAIVERNRREALNPGGTGGGYIPEKFVTLRGIDSSFRLSDNHFIAIRNALQGFLQEKSPEQDQYTVTADKETVSTVREPNVYQYTSFNVTTSDKKTYKVVFFVDYVTTHNTAFVLEGNLYSRNSIAYRNIDILYKSGVPVYVVEGLIDGIEHDLEPKNVEFNSPTLSVNRDGSRLYKFNMTVDKKPFTVNGDFYYDLAKIGTAKITNTETKDEYSFKTNAHIHD